MPTTRRRGGATAGTRNQATLSFNNRSARVTKPSIHDPATKKAQTKLSEPVETDIIGETAVVPESETAEEPEEDEQATEETSVPVQPAEPTPRKKRTSKATSSTISPRELAAQKTSDAQIKKYWKAEEDSRLAPRVHQSSVPLHEKILRHFDLSSQYGPCIGIQRLSRWKRANTLGLEPPVEVLAVLLKEEDKKASQGCGKLAYIDELGGGRVGIVE